jgi:hypothetical protein
MTCGFPIRLGWAVASLLPVALAGSLAANALVPDLSGLSPGQAVPGPWQTSDRDEGILARGGIPQGAGEGTGWIELRDDSPEATANVRQRFEPVPAGRFSLRIRLGPLHSGPIGIYLGTGQASAPAERVIDLKTNDRGNLRLGSRGERQGTPLLLIPGSEVRLYLEFAPTGDGMEVVLGSLDEHGREREASRYQVPVDQAQPISALRITSDSAPTGAHFYVSDLKLLPR